jgi:hypothetical protein
VGVNMIGALRSRLGLYGIVVVVVVLITSAVIAGYRFYYTNLAATPEKAVSTYVDTLNRSDLATLYTLTLGAASQSQAEFANQVGALIKDKRLTIDGTSRAPIGRQGNTFYFTVTARLSTPDGSYRMAPLILEAAQEGNIWRVGLFLSPAVVPSSQ